MRPAHAAMASGQHEVLGYGQEPLVQRLPSFEVLGIGQAERGVGLRAVVLGGQVEVERGVVLVHEEGVAHGPPLIAAGHNDGVEKRPRYLLGEQHGEEADQGQGLPHEAQGIGDHQVRDGQQPLHQGRHWVMWRSAWNSSWRGYGAGMDTMAPWFGPLRERNGGSARLWCPAASGASWRARQARTLRRF